MSDSNGEYLELPELDYDDNDLKPKKAKIMKGKYIIHEALGGDITFWQNKQIAMAKYTEEGKFSSMGNIAEREPILIHLCTYLPDSSGNLRMVKVDESTDKPDPQYRVPLNTVRAWPGHIQTKVFEQIKRMSNIEDDTEEVLEKRIERDTKKLAEMRKGKTPAKNEPDSTTDTSE